MVKIPQDFLTHEDAWIAALERLIELEPESTEPDVDEKAYWRHELNAMRRAYAELHEVSE